MARPGIKLMEIRKGDKVIDRVSKADLPMIGEGIADIQSGSAQALTDRRDADRSMNPTKVVVGEVSAVRGPEINATFRHYPL